METLERAGEVWTPMIYNSGSQLVPLFSVPIRLWIALNKTTLDAKNKIQLI